MEIIIHRGAAQIGGCCTEIRTQNARIFIDLGQELVEPGETPRPLSIDGVTCGEVNCDGVFFTHYHGDHIGLYGDALPGIPLYMGDAAKEIFQTLQACLAYVDEDVKANLPKLDAIQTFQANQAVQVGDITVTPYFTDHSTYDAYMFLIEAEGKRILHTGDYRTHGYLGKGVLPMLNRYVGQVDVLITEGTTLSRSGQSPESEGALRRRMKDCAKQYKRVFLLCSSTNIDRLASLYAVSQEFRRPFICDRYQRDVLEVVTRRAGKYTSLYDFDRAYVYGDNLLSLMENRGFCMPVRASRSFLPILERFNDDDTLLIYSVWTGYLERDAALAELVNGRKHHATLHTTGHATKAQIQSVCAATKPRLGVIPIHTEAPQQFDDVCSPYPVIHLPDGKALFL